MLCTGDKLAVALRALGAPYFEWQAQHIVTWRADFVAGAAFSEHGCSFPPNCFKSGEKKSFWKTSLIPDYLA